MVEASFKLTARGNALSKFIAEAKRSEMEAGFIDGAAYPDGESVASVAKDNEYGVMQDNQPPRPFMRPAVANNGKKWVSLFGSSIPGMFGGGLTLDESMGMLGEVVVTDIRKSIRAVTKPSLAPLTIAMRKARGNTSTKPLEDTMTMMNNVSHKVLK